VWHLEFQLLLADPDAFTRKFTCRLEGILDRHAYPTRFWPFKVEWLGFLPSDLTLKILHFAHIVHLCIAHDFTQ
jgi:hypothetical protein